MNQGIDKQDIFGRTEAMRAFIAGDLKKAYKLKFDGSDWEGIKDLQGNNTWDYKRDCLTMCLLNNDYESLYDMSKFILSVNIYSMEDMIITQNRFMESNARYTPIIKDIFDARTQSEVNRVEELIRHESSKSWTIDSIGCCVFLYSRVVEMDKMLLSKGICSSSPIVNNRLRINGKTHLQWAIKIENWNLARKLLRLGSDPNVLDSEGHTALDYAEGKMNWGLADLIKNRYGGVKAKKKSFTKQTLIKSSFKVASIMGGATIALIGAGTFVGFAVTSPAVAMPTVAIVASSIGLSGVCAAAKEELCRREPRPIRAAIYEMSKNVGEAVVVDGVTKMGNIF